MKVIVFRCIQQHSYCRSFSPEVNDAITRQIKKLNTNTRYIYDKLYEYGNRLLKFPKIK